MGAGHAVNGDVCVWAEDGHVIDDDVCFNGKDICTNCCGKAGGCCYDPDVDGCYVDVEDHADKHTPDKIAFLCWGAECRKHGPLMNGDWFDRATAEAAAEAHRKEHAP